MQQPFVQTTQKEREDTTNIDHFTIQLSTSGLVLFEVAITDWGDFKVGDAVRMMGSMEPGAL